MQALSSSTVVALSLLCEAARWGEPLSGAELDSTLGLEVGRAERLLLVLEAQGLFERVGQRLELARPPGAISVADVAIAIEGAAAFTLDSTAPRPLRQLIIGALEAALGDLTLADIVARRAVLAACDGAA